MRWMIVAAALALGCQGPVGPQGRTGPQGQQGPQGDPGMDGAGASDGSRIIASIHCGGPLEGTQIGFSYDVAQFKNGNVFCSGSIEDPEIQASGTNLYAPSQNGYSNCPVLITLDEYGNSTGGYWSLSLDRASLVTTIVYRDADLSDGSDTWTAQPSKCILNAY